MVSRCPDALVIGAGIVGLACAEALARAGLSVQVIDPMPLASGATAAGMGHLVVMDDSPAQLALTRRGVQLWRGRAGSLPRAAQWDTRGTIWVARADAEMTAARRRRERLAVAGVEASLLDARALAEAEPRLAPGMLGGLYVPGDRILYPPAAAASLLRSTGGRVVCSRAPAVTAIADGVARLADGTTRAAGVIVNAAGERALELMPTRPPGLSIRPRRGHLAITARYPGFCRHQLIELGYMTSAHGHAARSVAFNLQPRTTGQLLIGSSREYGAVGATLERAVDLGVLREMLARAVEYVPALAELDVIRSWTGVRAATEDHLPIIGRAPGMTRTWLACGHEGLGITTALVTGELIAHGVAGSPLGPGLEPRWYDANRARGGAEVLRV